MKFNDTFWSQCLAVFVLILFLPLVIIAIPIIAVIQEIECIGERRRYKKSNYCLNFGVRYRAGITDTPAYRFYESAIRRGLQMEYHHIEAQRIDYFLRDGIIYFLLDFDYLCMDDNEQWVADRDGEYSNFEDEIAQLSVSFEHDPSMPIKILVERKILPIENIQDISLPEQLHLIQTYETAFDDGTSEYPLASVAEVNL